MRVKARQRGTEGLVEEVVVEEEAKMNSLLRKLTNSELSLDSNLLNSETKMCYCELQ